MQEVSRQFLLMLGLERLKYCNDTEIYKSIKYLLFSETFTIRELFFSIYQIKNLTEENPIYEQNPRQQNFKTNLGGRDEIGSTVTITNYAKLIPN